MHKVSWDDLEAGKLYYSRTGFFCLAWLDIRMGDYVPGNVQELDVDGGEPILVVETFEFNDKQDYRNFAKVVVRDRVVWIRLCDHEVYEYGDREVISSEGGHQ